jgi:hypothetical protein
MKTSAFVIMSEPERLNFPYIESIKSFLPVCDEIIVVCNSLEEFQDGSIEKIKQIDPKVQVIGSIFNYKKYGWLSQGIMRSCGYYACTGDIVLMFDADDILHEKDVEILKKKLWDFNHGGEWYAFWRRYKFRQKNIWTLQCKYPGIYNKDKLGNNFNFFGAYLAEANFELIPRAHGRGTDFDFYLYGYEKLWDNKKNFVHKLLDGKLDDFPEGSINKQYTDEEYINNWVKNQYNKVQKEGQFMDIKDQPMIIQEKLNAITPDLFGYDNFEGRI